MGGAASAATASHQGEGGQAGGEIISTPHFLICVGPCTVPAYLIVVLSAMVHSFLACGKGNQESQVGKLTINRIRCTEMTKNIST